jgi:Ni/Fe-hydrogenase subunit HybB-like protein
MFHLEFTIGVILPVALLAFPAVRRNTRGLYGASLLVVLGFILHRLNVSITGFEGAQGGHYIPSWGEVFITLMLLALGFGAFRFAVQHFNVFPEEGPGVPVPAANRLAPYARAEGKHDLLHGRN